MNSAERIDTVVQLGVPDRVPLGPLLDHFGATYAGITNHEFMYDPDKRIAAITKVLRELGPWDMTFLADTANGPLLEIGMPMQMMRPGYELPDDEIHQFVEKPIMQPSDYARVAEVGFRQFRAELFERIYPEGARELAQLGEMMRKLPAQKEAVEELGAVVAYGGIMNGPLEFFSYARSFPEFCFDLYDCPDQIRAAVEASIDEALEMARGMATSLGVPRVFIGLARCSPACMSPRHFEQLALPSVEKAVNELAASGITALLHCDTDWTRFFEYFRRFPRGSCILELDGASDIFRAKEMLGDVMCIMGDVPAAMLAFSAPEKVRDYCKRLIEIVGKGGGFILSSGCSIPANAKPENVRAMYEAVEEYGWY
jgi:hypothetical protein